MAATATRKQKIRKQTKKSATVTDEYRAVRGSNISNKQAAVYGPELRRLFEAGKRTKEEILEEAKKKKSKLHSAFEWDNSIAGERYRLSQAGQLTRAIEIKLIVDNEPMWTRAFHAVPIKIVKGTRGWDARTQHEYYTVEEAENDETLAKTILWNALSDLRNFKARLEEYREVFPAVAIQSIDTAIASIEQHIQNGNGAK